MMVRWMVFFISMMASLTLLTPAMAQDGAPCKAWMASLKDYDAAFERVMRGEPEDLLHLIREAREPDRKASAQKRAGEKLSGLRNIVPPRELASLHGHLVAYAQAVADAVAAASPEDAGAKEPALRPCFETLLSYYREMRDLMRKRGCRGGDLDALEQNLIPRLEQQLAQGTAEAAP